MIDEGIAPGIEYGAAGWPLRGERVSGDMHVVRKLSDGALCAVVDGLGHGREAAEAAQRALATISAREVEDLRALFQHVHEDLRRTRGVALGAFRVDARAGELHWAGVGNVEGEIYRSPAARGGPRREALIARAGVVGYRLPRVSPRTYTVGSGDVLVLSTDGVRRDFAGPILMAARPCTAAQSLIETYGKKSDDALVLVVRITGGSV